MALTPSTSSTDPAARSLWRREWPLPICAAAAIAMTAAGSAVSARLTSASFTLLVLAVVSGVMLLAAMAIVRHAEELAHRLGEPRGTLLLTMTITGLEAAMVGLVMSFGEEKPALPRDTMYGVVMLVLNGFLGVALVIGGIRHVEQPYNPQSANAFLGMIIPFTVLSLVLPNYTKTTVGPTLSPFQMGFLSLVSVAIYALFLIAQTSWYRGFFVFTGGQEKTSDPRSASESPVHAEAPVQSEPQPTSSSPPKAPSPATDDHHHASTAPTIHHVVLLVLYAVTIVVLAKSLSKPLDAAVLTLGAPAALAGFLIALLVLAPESIAAVKAARRNELQRAVNILLGSALASIGLTVPIVIAVALATGRGLVLGLEPAETLLLALTLVVSIVTFSRPRTNMLMGSVHLLLFAVAVLMLFDD